ncbi:MAG: hypothetical protein ABEJ28_08075 [Salinigranum sp.]
MKRYPDVPRVEDAPDGFLERGHLWIEEKVDGDLLRFSMGDDGVLSFGDAERTYGPSDVPPALEYAVRHVRENFDRGSFAREVEAPASVAFFGVAVHRRRVDYDWRRTPPFLGFDVWSAGRDAFLPPDAAERAFDALGLRPIDVFEKEVEAAYFDPASYEIPRSNWYDGPAAGVVLKNKTGDRAQIVRPDLRGDDPDPAGDASSAGPTELAERYVTPDLVDSVRANLESGSTPATFEATYRQTLDFVSRAAHPAVFDGDVDPREFRSAVAARCREYFERSA